MTITAFCPGHISGYFKRIEGATRGSTGSIGAGIVISEGVTVTVSVSRTTSISIRQRMQNGTVQAIASGSPPLETALDTIGVRAAVLTECSLPIGAGFGLSAAALLATLTGVNRLRNLGLTSHELTRIAHETEVEHRTGLGDVAACQGGGRVVRRGPGIDAPIERSFDIPGEMYAISFGPIHTPSVLGSPGRMREVTAAFPGTQPKTFEGFFSRSREFAEKSSLVTPEVRQVLAHCKDQGVLASMTMLGNGVFAWGPGAFRVLSRYGRVFTFRIADSGAYILGDRS